MANQRDMFMFVQYIFWLILDPNVEFQLKKMSDEYIRDI
jgi:hypothetical protein